MSALTEQASSLAMEFNRDSTQLGMIASGIDAQVTQKVQTINDLAKQIASLNGQIQRVSVTGDNPNELPDAPVVMTEIGVTSEPVPLVVGIT